MIILSMLLLTLLNSNAHAAGSQLPATSTPLIEKGLDYLRNEQMSDGSWTTLIEVSSVMYNCNMIFLYEFLDRTEEKSAQIHGLLNYIWSRQNPDGGFPGYTGGASNSDITSLAYLAAKIGGESDQSERMTRLVAFIDTHIKFKQLRTALPYFMVFQLDRREKLVPHSLETLALIEEKELPWAKVVLFPFLHLFTTGQTHALKGNKFPDHFFKRPSEIQSHSLKSLNKDARFWTWMESHFNADGTMFDYTPTSVPALMALSTGGSKYTALLEKGLQSLEKFQVSTLNGLYQSPGEASIGETNAVLISLLQLGYTVKDPTVLRGVQFLMSMQQEESGAFGFSKHNTHFPDTDDTSNSIYVMKLASENADPLLAAELVRRSKIALAWLISVQNSDGGFGTWEKEKIRLLSRIAKKSGLVLSESVPEHTARIVVALALFKNEDPLYRKTYDRAVHFLLKVQQKDGSFSGTWFVDYLIGTSMVVAALGSAPEIEGVSAALEKSLSFIFSKQLASGGFSESPASFFEGTSIAASEASPAQTGLIVLGLLVYLKNENFQHASNLYPKLESAIHFLLATQKEDGLWHDKAWTGVTFPKIEYLIYPYVQEVSPLAAVGIYKKFEDKIMGPGSARQ